MAAVRSRDATLSHVIPCRVSVGVSAVTSLGDDVFVLRYVSNQQVEVYDAVSCVLQRHITVHGLGTYTHGLAACAHYICLYVSGCDNHSIHSAELTGSNAVTKWSVAKNPTGLSVNRAHNVVVACKGANKLQEYTSNGSLVREICLQAGVTSPCHAVQLSSGDYVVSLYTPGAVSVVGVDGQVRHSYGQSQTSHVGQLKNARGLAVTKNDDILVADFGNNRIVSMNSSLSSVQKLTLPVDGGIQQPVGLCLDESRGRLYVGEWGGSRRVLVFDNMKL